MNTKASGHHQWGWLLSPVPVVSAAAWPIVQVPDGSGARAQTALYRPLPTLPLPEAPPAVARCRESFPSAPWLCDRGAAPGCSVFLLSASACELVRLRVAAICYHVSRHNFASLTSTKHVGEVVGFYTLPPVGSAASQGALRDSNRGSGAVRRSQLLAGDIRTISISDCQAK